MKTSELSNQLETLGFYLKIDSSMSGRMYVVDCEYENLACIHSEELMIIDTNFGGFHELDTAMRTKLFVLLDRYICTSIDNRKHPDYIKTTYVKEYCKKLSWINFISYLEEDISPVGRFMYDWYKEHSNEVISIYLEEANK